MPTQLTYPGVYIEEIPSGVRTIAGVSTSITAFVGRAERGPVEEPTTIFSFTDYQRIFGGFLKDSTMALAVRDFFLNGGSHAVIVRIVGTDAKSASLTLGNLTFTTSSPGSWANKLALKFANKTMKTTTDGKTIVKSFDLTVVTTSPDGQEETIEEQFINVSLLDDTAQRIDRALASSRLIKVAVDQNAASVTNLEVKYLFSIKRDGFVQGADGNAATKDNLIDGIKALDRIDVFNLLCIPPDSRGSAIILNDEVTTKTINDEAAKYCASRRAFYIVNPHAGWALLKDVKTDAVLSTTHARNAAVFFPQVKQFDPCDYNQLKDFSPCGIIAGIIARTDAQRGVWKAPAGLDASISGIQGLAVKLTDAENGQLNQLGVNCLRSFPGSGQVVWGARTLDGSDRTGSEWKYIPVRRLALFIEESLYRGTQWVVFEPNDEPLWSQIRLNIGSFMHNLFRQGAFQGQTSREAYFVKCDSETTTQDDINRGVVNIIVGFAPLKPAEFVVIKLQQITGQLAT